MKFRVTALSIALSTVCVYGTSHNPTTGAVRGGYYNGYNEPQHQQQYYNQPSERQQGYYDQLQQQGQGQGQGEYQGVEQGYGDFQNQSERQDGQVALTSEKNVVEEEELPPLPEGWIEYIDPNSGKPYYYNSIDGTSTWTRPVVTTEPEPENGVETVSPPDFEEVVHEEVKNVENVEKDSKQLQSLEEVATEQGREHQEQSYEKYSNDAESSQVEAQVPSEDASKKDSPFIDEGRGSAIQQSLQQEQNQYEYQQYGQEQQRKGWGLSQQQQQQQGWGIQQRQEEWREPHMDKRLQNEELGQKLREQVLDQKDQNPPSQQQQWGQPSHKQQQQQHSQKLQNEELEHKQQERVLDHNPPPRQKQLVQPSYQQQGTPQQWGDTRAGEDEVELRQQQQRPQRENGLPMKEEERPQQQQPPQWGSQQQHNVPNRPSQSQYRWGDRTLPEEQKHQFKDPSYHKQSLQQHQQPRPDSLEPRVVEPQKEESKDAAKPGIFGSLFGKKPPVEEEKPDDKNRIPQPQMPYRITDPSPNRFRSSQLHGDLSAGTGTKQRGAPPPHQPQVSQRPPYGQHPPSHGNQQQQPPQVRYENKYGNESYGASPPSAYGQQQQQQGGQVQPYNPQQNASGSTVKNALGNALQGVLGFGEKAKTTASQYKDSVLQEATRVSESVSTSSSSLLGRFREQADNLQKSFFEGNQQTQGDSSYSVSPYGRSPPGGPQQQPRYPPQNYGGYPQGYAPPGPRVNQAYPHQEQRGETEQYPQRSPPGQGGPQQRPPMQSQYGQQQNPGQMRPQGFDGPRGGPPVQYSRRPPQQHQNQQQQHPPPNQRPPQHQQKGTDPWQHPGLDSGF